MVFRCPSLAGFECLPEARPKARLVKRQIKGNADIRNWFGKEAYRGQSEPLASQPVDVASDYLDLALHSLCSNGLTRDSRAGMALDPRHRSPVSYLIGNFHLLF